MTKNVTTVRVILIGNSDDKLSQKRWSEYINDCGLIVNRYGKVLFRGGSENSSRSQNFSWLMTYNNFSSGGDSNFKKEISKLAELYDQDSIAFVEGTSALITPNYYNLSESS